MKLLQEIVNLPFTQLIKHINYLDNEYHKRTGRRVCRSCSGDVQFMINYLKNLRTMSKFEFKNPIAIYRVQKGKQERISQSILTDVLAIEYIAINPERISLFKTYPDNWQELAEQAGAIIEQAEEDSSDEETDVPCDDCMRDNLNKLSMSKLKKQYPEIPITFAMKKVELVEAIIQMKLQESKDK